ncbi:hypothetical protein LDENG_00130750 [Lucifuga dentata]|nr:hypothetical protein LDENG_00130750 [Lucifuga dentata]
MDSFGSAPDGRDPNSGSLIVEGCPSGESPATVDISPRKRLHSAEDARCCSRPPPEGAGSVSISESEEKGNFCPQCQKKVSELKKQASALADQNSLKDPGYAAFLFEQLQAPGSHEAGVSCCQVCSTPLYQLRHEALQTLQPPVLSFTSDMAAIPATSFIAQPSRFTVSSSSPHAKQPPKGQHAAHSVLPIGEWHRVPGWSQSPSVSSGSKTSVQVTVAGQLTGTLSSITIQAQQYLEGMWSISRVNNFLPQPKPAPDVMGDAKRDVTAMGAPLTTMTSSSSGGGGALMPCQQRSSSQAGQCAVGLPAPVTNTSTSPSPSSSVQSSSAAASFFIR